MSINPSNLESVKVRERLETLCKSGKVFDHRQLDDQYIYYSEIALVGLIIRLGKRFIPHMRPQLRILGQSLALQLEVLRDILMIFSGFITIVTKFWGVDVKTFPS